MKETNRQCKHSRCEYATVKIHTPSLKLHMHIFLSYFLGNMRSDLAQIPALESRESSFNSGYVQFIKWQLWHAMAGSQQQVKLHHTQCLPLRPSLVQYYQPVRLHGI